MILIRTQPSLNRDFTLLSLFILFLMVMMSLWVAYETYAHQRERTSLKLEHAAQRIDAALTQEIRSAGQLLDAVGRLFLASKNRNYHDAALIFKAFKQHRENNHVVLGWINADQKLELASDYGVADPTIDLSDRDYVKRAISKPGQVIINRPIKGRINKRWQIPLSLGITDNDGRFLGVIFMGLNIKNLESIATVAAGDEHIRFAITNRAFTLLTSTFEKEHHFKRHFDLSELSKKDFLNPQADTYSTANPWDSKTAFAYYQTAKTYPFVYFLTYARAESMADLQRILVARIFQLIAVGGFLLFVLWTVRKRIIQPVIKLSDSTRAATLGSSFETVSYQGPQEIQTLNQEIYKFWLYTQERKRIEKELRHKLSELIRIRESANLTNQTKNEFFHFIIDALKTSISHISDQAETIKDQHFGAISNPRYVKNAEAVFENSKAILQLLDKAQKISNNESGLIELNEEWLDSGQMIKKALQIFNETKSASLQIQIDSQTHLPQLHADKQRLRQLFFYIFTIITNQISPNTPIRVSNSISNNYVQFFFSFTQQIELPAETEAVSQMSLTLARLIASMHDGSVEVKTAPGKTTSLAVKLPVSRMKA